MKPLLDSQTKALLAAGFIRPSDVILAVLSVMGLLAAVVVALVYHSLTYLVVGFSLVYLLILILLVILAYRACYFILMARADINLLPDAAAKLAVSYQLGREG